MRDYQMAGLNWLIHLYDNGINGILADEMGLGKTLQTISLLGYLREYRGIKGPHLIIVPKSTLHNWLNEFKRWCPIIDAFQFHGNKEERNVMKAEKLQHGNFDVCITSYEMVIKEKGHFKRFHWRYIIIDEAHRIKNENSLLSKVVRMFTTNYRLLITGTPLQNSLRELWALLNYLIPEVFSDADKFEEWFGMGDGDKEKEAEVVQQLHKVLRPFLLRRVKSDVERGLPPKKETILKIGMSELQRTYYKMLLQKDIEAINGAGERSRLLNIVMQLRKCCNHPYLFQGAEPGPPYITGEHLITNSGKMVLLDKLLKRLQERGSRCLIFSQMTRVLDILEDFCIYRQYQYCRIDGNTSGQDRENSIDDFNREGSSKFIFLLSTRAGGLGINLATADIVILYDSDWNPQMDLQAMDRAHRIGQKKEVQVFRFCTEASIEEKVIEKAYKKLRLDALVIQQGRLTQSNNKASKEDLLNMVRYGAELIFSSEASNITDQDIDAILTKGESATKELNQKMERFTEGAMKFSLDGRDMDIYDYKDPNDNDQSGAGILKSLVAENWVEPPRRQRQRITNYSETDYYRQTFKSGGGGGGKSERGMGASGPKLPKMPQLQDFQFFNIPRIVELFEKEQAYELYKHNQAVKKAQQAAAGDADETQQMDVDAESLEEESQPLTEEELAERERLLEEGFSNWNRRDFNAFIRACEKHGRNALNQICHEIEGKTESEVLEYAKAFFTKYKQINEWERYIKQIEKGEEKIVRQEKIMAAITKKMELYRNPWVEMKIFYGANKGKAYTEEEDRFLVCMLNTLGYGQWDELKSEIRKSPRFRFDWFIKSRTAQELSRRCETLIRLIEKEMDQDDGRPSRSSKSKNSALVDDIAGGSKKRKTSANASGSGGNSIIKK
eukprot:TRINITY_DN8110_c3_g1_i2.p1 TRINITY_DN8110_c3_g1~~TRINITY_DN8110_c3_g1_i2.p1  ORF type:complete len:1007 (+),score=121.42 TRINITY_DN8110_c3_g1_i2:328-3021(+)